MEKAMTAYMIMQITISNEARWKKYRDAVVPLTASFGGKHLVRGAEVEVLEGHHDGGRLAMFEFPSTEAIRAFWNSPDYVPVKEMRRDAATLDIWAVPGA